MKIDFNHCTKNATPQYGIECCNHIDGVGRFGWGGGSLKILLYNNSTFWTWMISANYTNFLIAFHHST